MQTQYLVNKVIDGIRVKVYFSDRECSEEEKREKIARLICALTEDDLPETA